MQKSPYAKSGLKVLGEVRSLTLGAGSTGTDGQSTNVAVGNMGMM